MLSAVTFKLLKMFHLLAVEWTIQLQHNESLSVKICPCLKVSAAFHGGNLREPLLRAKDYIRSISSETADGTNKGRKTLTSPTFRMNSTTEQVCFLVVAVHTLSWTIPHGIPATQKDAEDLRLAAAGYSFRSFQSLWTLSEVKQRKQTKVLTAVGESFSY